MSAIKKLMTKSFLERTISGIILVLIAIITITMGGNILLVTCGLISLIGYYEFLKAYLLAYSKQHNLMGYVGYLAIIGYYVALNMGYKQAPLFILVLLFICLMAVYVFTYPAYLATDVMIAAFGVFYIGMMLSYIYQVRVMNSGIYLVWLIFLSSWGCDTCAYLVGVMFGKHKMAPVLSPNKSIEGGIGGVVGAVLLTVLYTCIFGDKMGEHAVIIYPIAVFFGAMASQVGDLMASGIKRDKGIKDYGKLIPGHGGIMDRFDSMIVTAPIIFYFIQIMKFIMGVK